ncbi:Protein SirB1 N-terminal domain-containing protein [Frankia sp. AiPs1]|uniref:transglutaminase family protein n=1 Tax=Frankia sp. AiPa1 TaxID=573492 RepID=UPI00202B4DBB|nr:transglutaminase-like domain-containing protein [Frankia sp. AiPa1]MCL9758315.1 transglutaminase-like domain-containing protein [Frankia sp. AiPa1]
MSSRSRFAEAVRQEPVDLALACHLLAAEAYTADAGTAEASTAEPPDPSVTLEALDALAARARPLLAARTTTNRPFPRAERGNSAGAPGTGQSAASLGAAGTGTGTGGARWGHGFGWLEPRAAAEALHEALGLDAGFAGTADDYEDLRSSLLPDVLRRRRGLPILLSIVWLEVARRLGIAAYPVGLPGHVVVAVGSPEDFVLVDPFAAGRLLTIHDAAAKVRASGVAFSRAHLAPMTAADVLTRILGNIRVLAARTDAPRTRLWAVELSLLLPHHPATLRRERGELRIRLGDFLGGAQDLTAFADSVTAVEPTAAAAARQAAITARARLN